MGGSTGKETTDPFSLKGLLILVVRFLIWGPVCLIAWMLVLPIYAQGVGSTAGFLLDTAFGLPVESVRMDPYTPGPEGEHLVMRVARRVQASMDRQMQFSINGVSKTFPEVAKFFINIAPFTALTLSAVSLRFRRKVIMLLAGFLLLALSHTLFVVVSVYWADTFALARSIPTAIGMVFITLPFLLWIVMGYGSSLMHLTLFDDNAVREG